MRVVTNQKLVDRNRRIATWLFLATLVVLVGGFILINYSVFTGSAPPGVIIILQALLLPVALALTLVSVRMTNHWARKPYPEEVFDESVKGLSRKSILYHYYHFPARHVLIAPQGVFAIVTRWHDGKFSVDDEDQWKTHKNAFLRVFSLMRMDGIGNPTDEARQAAEHVQEQLAEIAPDVEVQPLILFINSNADLEIGDVSVPVLYADDKVKPNLTDHLRSLNKQTDSKNKGNQKATLPLTDEQIEAFEARTIDA